MEQILHYFLADYFKEFDAEDDYIEGKLKKSLFGVPKGYQIYIIIRNKRLRIKCCSPEKMKEHRDLENSDVPPPGGYPDAWFVEPDFFETRKTVKLDQLSLTITTDTGEETVINKKL